MDASTRTPTWMVGLLSVFALSAAITFGMFVYSHAEKAALIERHNQLSYDVKELRGQLGATEARIAPLEGQIAKRRVILTALKNQEEQAREDTERLVQQNQLSAKAIADSVAKLTKTEADLLKEARDRRLEVGQEELRAFEKQRTFASRLETQHGKNLALAEDIKRLEEKYRAERHTVDERLKQLSERRYQLTQQREASSKDIRPDGEIMQAKAEDGFVVINLGHQQHLRKGTKFTVYNRRAGQLTAKGTIEVTQVEALIATARVLEETNANDPLVSGDFITNPVYDPNKVLSYAVSGNFSHYSKDELKRLIVENGLRLDHQLTVNTDYLIAGDYSDAALKQAIDLGIKVISEDQFMESHVADRVSGKRK